MPNRDMYMDGLTPKSIDGYISISLFMYKIHIMIWDIPKCIQYVPSMHKSLGLIDP